MKKLLFLLLSLLCLMAPALAESPDALPVPEGCQVMENYISPNSISYLDFEDEKGDYFRGWVGENTAMFIEDTPEGLVFAGYVRQEDGWLRTTSTPLPEGSWVQYIVTSENSFCFSFPHPQGLTDQKGDTLWIYCWFELEPDGVWRFKVAQSGLFAYFFTEDALVVNLLGYAYGACTFDRDITKLDWETVPLSWQEALQCISPDMGVIGAEVLPLYSDAACTELIADYRYATPVTVLAREGNMAQVRIADSEIIGWLDAESLLLGAAQLVTYQYEDQTITEMMATTQAPWLYTHKDTQLHLYDAPDGNLLYILEYGEDCQLMSDLGNGWYHVCTTAYLRDILPEDMPCSFYVRAKGAITQEQLDALLVQQQDADDNASDLPE